MFSTDKKDRLEIEGAALRDTSFARFLDEPSTKFILSFIPEGREADAVKTVLRSAFDAGFNCGGGFFAADMLKSLMNRDIKRP